MLQILCHAYLSHELVFVAVHARQSSDVSKNKLQGVGQLEGVNVTETKLNVHIDDKLGQM